MCKIYTNNSTKYQLIGNCEDIISQGTKQECINKMKFINVGESKYGILQVVKPGETIKVKFAKPIKIESKDYTKELEKWFA